MEKGKYYDLEFDNLTDSILLGAERKKHFGDNKTTGRCYITSNENLQDFLSQIDFKGKRVLTVGSSGDQALNALYYGAKEVIIIDANPYARAFIEYKMAVIKNFRYDEMVDLLGITRRNLFSSKIYSKISHDLSKPVQAFWDNIMLESSDEWRNITSDNLTSTKINMLITQGYASLSSEFYNSPSGYYKLQDILTKGDFKLSFKQAFVKDFPKRVDGKFDVIILSNIIQHMGSVGAKVNFELPVKKLYKNNLNDGGIIQFYYDYDGIYFLPEKKQNKKFAGQKPRYEGNHDFSVGFIQKPKIDVSEESSESE